MLHGHYIERRSLASTTVSRDIAHHLYTRQIPGFIYIITSRPEVFMASVSKQWSAVAKQVERQMASTLNPVRKEELIIALSHMQALRFSVGMPSGEQGRGTGIIFLTPEQCQQTPPVGHTMYIAEPIDDPTLEEISCNMPPYGLIVAYEA